MKIDGLKTNTNFKGGTSIVTFVEKKGENSLCEIVNNEVIKEVTKRISPKIDAFNSKIEAQNPIDETKTGNEYILELIKNSDKKARLYMQSAKAGETLYIPPYIEYHQDSFNKDISRYAFTIDDKNSDYLKFDSIIVRKFLGVYRIKNKWDHVYNTTTRNKGTFIKNLSDSITEQLEKIFSGSNNI